MTKHKPLASKIAATMRGENTSEIAESCPTTHSNERENMNAETALVHQLNEIFTQLWGSEKTRLIEEAKRIEAGPVGRARQELGNGNLHGFHLRFPEISNNVSAFAKDIRTTLRRVENELSIWLHDTAPLDMTKKQIKDLLEEKSLDFDIPPAMQRVLALENTLGQEEVDLVLSNRSKAGSDFISGDRAVCLLPDGDTIPIHVSRKRQ